MLEAEVLGLRTRMNEPSTPSQAKYTDLSKKVWALCAKARLLLLLCCACSPAHSYLVLHFSFCFLVVCFFFSLSMQLHRGPRA